ncbi:hypothetical protein TWF730_000308 [Orbilia blumenaviensis]|uniref:Uncharacterized protein n=1 Tax=Orbilia blumenaviensis TaxID=1796055 RepID=A0AAV9VL58_9PEZI
MSVLEMKVSTAVLIAIAYASASSSALPIANGASLDKRQTSEIVVPITSGTALVSPGTVASDDNGPGAVKHEDVGFPTIAPTPVVVPIAFPAQSSSPLPSTNNNNDNNNNMGPSRPGGIPPGARSPLAFKPGRTGTQGQQLKEEVLTDPTLQLSAQKRKFLEEVPDTIWDRITLQPPGTFERQLDQLVFESRMPGVLVPLLAAAP